MNWTVEDTVKTTMNGISNITFIKRRQACRTEVLKNGDGRTDGRVFSLPRPRSDRQGEAAPLALHCGDWLWTHWMRTNKATTGLRLTTEWQRNWIYWITLVLCLLTIYTSHGPMADQLVRVTGWEGGAYASCVRASCSGRLTDDKPMSRLSD